MKMRRREEAPETPERRFHTACRLMRCGCDQAESFPTREVQKAASCKGQERWPQVGLDAEHHGEAFRRGSEALTRAPRRRALTSIYWQVWWKKCEGCGFASSFCEIRQKGPHTHCLFRNQPSNLCFYLVVVEIEAQQWEGWGQTRAVAGHPGYI